MNTNSLTEINLVEFLNPFLFTKETSKDKNFNTKSIRDKGFLLIPQNNPGKTPAAAIESQFRLNLVLVLGSKELNSPDIKSKRFYLPTSKLRKG